MLESQRNRDRYKSQLKARGLSDDEAGKVSNTNLSAFRPAFVHGRHHRLVEDRDEVSTVTPRAQRAESAEQNSD